MEKDRKKFKDTKVGKFLKEKAPGILDTVGDVLPDKGVLGVVKGLIDKDSAISPEDRENALELLKMDLEELELHAKDRDSARNREVELAKAGGTDWMMYVAGLVGLGLFVFIVVAVVYMPHLADNKLLIHVLGIIEGVCTSIFFYYFGSSKGSNDKNQLLK